MKACVHRSGLCVGLRTRTTRPSAPQLVALLTPLPGASMRKATLRRKMKRNMKSPYENQANCKDINPFHILLVSPLCVCCRAAGSSAQASLAHVLVSTYPPAASLKTPPKQNPGSLGLLGPTQHHRSQTLSQSRNIDRIFPCRREKRRTTNNACRQEEAVVAVVPGRYYASSSSKSYPKRRLPRTSRPVDRSQLPILFPLARPPTLLPRPMLALVRSINQSSGRHASCRNERTKRIIHLVVRVSEPQAIQSTLTLSVLPPCTHTHMS